MHNHDSFDRFFKWMFGAGCAVIVVYLLIVMGVLGGLGWLAWQLIQRL